MTEEKRETLSDEDLFRLELLADGELDEESRRLLLDRLEKTSDGWRSCALAFLEAQCLRESLKKGILSAEPAPAERPSAAGSFYAEPLPAHGRPDRFPSRRVFPFGGKNRGKTVSALSKNCLEVHSEMICCCSCSPPAEADGAPLALSSAKPKAASGRKHPRRLPVLVSCACAVLFAGLVGLRVFHNARVETSGPLPDQREFAASENSVAESADETFFAEDLPSAEIEENHDALLMTAAGVAEKRLSPRSAAKIPAAPAPALGSDSRPAESVVSSGREKGGVQHITIRRPGGLDDISVPCVEAESYVSDNSAAEALAQNYREAGCQVETLHEDLEFRLKNGKTVIVPVDTIDVQRAPQQTLHFL